MTRKRFIKLLMAEGKSRNQAVAIAGTFKGHWSYQVGYGHYRRIPDGSSLWWTRPPYRCGWAYSDDRLRLKQLPILGTEFMDLCFREAFGKAIENG